VLDFPADLFANAAGAFADTLTHAAHAFAKLFASLDRPAVPDVSAKALASTTGTLACSLVGVTDAALSHTITTPASPTLRHGQLAFRLVLVGVLVLLIRNLKHAGKGCWHSENRRENYGQKK
jgi:hypothetical protein